MDVCPCHLYSANEFSRHSVCIKSNQIIFYARTYFATPPFVPHVTESSIVYTNLVILLRQNHSRN